MSHWGCRTTLFSSAFKIALLKKKKKAQHTSVFWSAVAIVQSSSSVYGIRSCFPFSGENPVNPACSHSQDVKCRRFVTSLCDKKRTLMYQQCKHIRISMRPSKQLHCVKMVYKVTTSQDGRRSGLSGRSHTRLSRPRKPEFPSPLKPNATSLFLNLTMWFL